jgi:predicted MFS family arabinose efflux permease
MAAAHRANQANPAITDIPANPTGRANPAAPPWRAILAGFCATLVGLGLARFGYTPLLPAIIDAHWFSAWAATYLGAANLVGYLLGALLGGPMSARWPVRSVLRAMMLATAASLLACAWPVDFAWFFGWRVVSGIAGGALMVLAAPTVLAHVTPQQRGLASGMVFAGIGLGIAASGTLVPLLLRQGLAATWIGLALLALVLTAVAWHGWPAAAPVAAGSQAAHAAHAARAHPPVATGRLRALTLSYALNAVCLVPHMIFLVDFVARGLGQGLAVGAQYWVVFGLGAIVGPVLSGYLADRVGFGAALRIAFAVQAGSSGMAGSSCPAWSSARSRRASCRWCWAGCRSCWRTTPRCRRPRGARRPPVLRCCRPARRTACRGCSGTRVVTMRCSSRWAAARWCWRCLQTLLLAGCTP